MSGVIIIKRPILKTFVFISLLSVLVQIVWHKKYWSSYNNNNNHYNNNNDNDYGRNGVGLHHNNIHAPLLIPQGIIRIHNNNSIDEEKKKEEPQPASIPPQSISSSSLRQQRDPVQREGNKKRQAQKQKRKRKRIKLIHVMNTYTIPNKNNNTSRSQPFDQWSTIKSIERALEQNLILQSSRQRSNNLDSSTEILYILDVDFVCAIFESDIQYLPQNLPCRKVILKRSTKTEYYSSNSNSNNNHAFNNNDTEFFLENFFFGDHDSQPVKELPFLQDIIDITISDYYKQQHQQQQHNTKNDDIDIDDDINNFYIMLTNSDIGLTKDFYSSYLLPKLHRRSKSTNNNNTTAQAHALSLSINRLTIPMTKQIQVISNKYNNNDNNNDNDNDNDNNNNNNVESESLSKLLLNTIDNDIELGFGLIHPGYDCFVMHSSILKNKKQINLGNMFAGYPPWGTILKKILKNMAGGKSNNNSYTNYKSSPNGTYHIGNDGSKWNKKKVVETTESMSESSNNNFTNIITNNNSTVVTEAEAESEIIILKQIQKQKQRKQQQQDQKDYYDTIIQNCPSKLIGTHPYTYLNTINCGLLWSNTSNMKMSTTSTTETSSNSTMKT